jgi:hypothetical protein
VAGLLLDVNVQGYGPTLVRLIEAAGLGPFWDALDLRTLTLADLGLTDGTTDRAIWVRCQADGLVLLTDNRSCDGPDALEQAIADSLTTDSLPVLTIGSKERFRRDRDYAQAVAVALLDKLTDIAEGRHRGVGRLYLPR